MKITILKDSATVETVVEFNQVVNVIRKGYKQEYLFAPSGVITISGRKRNNLKYTGLILLTFETGSDEELNNLFQNIIEMSTTYCCFRNHLGNGLNVLVKTDCWDGHHKTGYNQVVEAFQEYLSLEVSNYQPDEFILCQLSHDSDIYYNPDSKTFKVDIRTKKLVVTESELYELYRDEFEEQIKRTEQYIKLSDKTRNNYYATLASNCSNAGIPIALALEFIRRSSILNSAIKGIVNRVYRKASREKRSPKDTVFSIYFNKFFNYRPEIKTDERVFYETIVYKSIRLGIPFYYTAKDVKNELGLNRTRRESTEELFMKMGFLDVYTDKVKEDDKWDTTFYRLKLQNFEEATHKIMVDPTYFLKIVMPLLSQKDNTSTGYSPAE